MGPLRPMRRLLALVLLFGIPAAAVPAVYRVGAVLPLTGPDAPAMVDVPRGEPAGFWGGKLVQESATCSIPIPPPFAALRVWEAGINALNSGRGVNVTTLSGAGAFGEAARGPLSDCLVLSAGAILYFQVELFILDDESDEAVHMNKTSRLLDEERVQFMLGGHYRALPSLLPLPPHPHWNVCCFSLVRIRIAAAGADAGCGHRHLPLLRGGPGDLHNRCAFLGDFPACLMCSLFSRLSIPFPLPRFLACCWGLHHPTPGSWTVCCSLSSTGA